MSKWIKKYGLGKWFKRDNLLIMVLAGILLVIIVIPVDGKSEAETGSVGETGKQAEEQKVVFTEESTAYSYADYLERELEDILVQMKGVGKVAVMITLEGSGELIVHQDEIVVNNNTTETDSQGGSRIISQTDLQGKTVYEKEGQGESPYVVQTKLPKVSGVLIVAQGAGDGSVKKNIIQIAEALLDVEAHKVTVVTMKE